jgi:phospholipid/cholesterol/gamma-HCH transport system substrate-binding protein
MAHRPRWKDLTIGIASALAVILGAVLILVFGRVGTLHGKTFTLYVTTDAARGVIRGTEVWLDGQKVGLVKNVSFRPPTTSPKDRLVIALEVLDDARPRIRFDTRVQVRAGGTLIGDQVVYLSSGTARRQGVANGDTIRAGEQADLESATADIAAASKELPGIIENVKLLSTQLTSTQSVLGAFMTDENGKRQLASARAKSARLMTRLSESDGSIALLLNNRDALIGRANRAMAQADSIRALMGSDKHSLGRFRRDPTLMGDVTAVRAELARVQALAADPNGTIGRVRADSIIMRNIHRDFVSLDSLFADIKKHPLRYIAF